MQLLPWAYAPLYSDMARNVAFACELVATGSHELVLDSSGTAMLCSWVRPAHLVSRPVQHSITFSAADHGQCTATRVLGGS